MFQYHLFGANFVLMGAAEKCSTWLFPKNKPGVRLKLHLCHRQVILSQNDPERYYFPKKKPRSTEFLNKKLTLGSYFGI